MNLIDGKMISSKLKEEYKRKIETLDRKPSLAMIRIGDDAAAAIYVRSKAKMCQELGIPCAEYALKSTITQEELIAEVKKLNEDDNITAILIESPIPNHLNILEAFDTIDPKKMLMD